MNRATFQHADDGELKLLVFGDEDSAAYRAAAAHVEHCDACQQRLSRVAASDAFASSVYEALADGSSVYDSTCHDQDSQRQTKDALEFLSPPSHPEMLGRLGRYEVERVIGAGGMGLVLKAFDTELNRPVAVKVLARYLAHSGAARQRFAREARAAAAVVHEHVVAIHNVDAEGDTPFLVMQYVAGESLQARVDRGGPLTVTELLRIGIQAAAGLAAAHAQGVVHRDIKPANILLETGVERVLLTDFGLARTVDDASLTHTGIVAGTPHYMSPEQANGAASDHRSDLFSLGAVLYFMATGHPPFRAERAMGVLHRICHEPHRPVWQVNAAIPDDLSDLIDRLLEKNPARRIADAAQVCQQMQRLLADCQSPRRRRRWPRLVRRRPWLATSAAMTCVLIAGGLVQLAFFGDVPGSPEQESQRGDQAASTAPSQPQMEQSATLTGLESLQQENELYSREALSISQRLDRLESMTWNSQFAWDRDGFNEQVEALEERLNQIDGGVVTQRSRQ